MGENSAISWTTHTFNMWWGCWKIAKECENCYADATAHRYTAQFGELWGRTAGRRFFGESHWREPEKWNRKAERLGERHRVFVGSMMDWAEIHPDPEIRAQMDAARARLWELIKSTPHLDWLLLTKRPDDAAGLLPWATIGAPPHPTPWRNVWIGVTAGTNATMRENVNRLREIPAAVRFVSCEPILEHISQEVLDLVLAPNVYTGAKIHWLIVGDESGHGARAAQGDWIRTVREACARHGVAFHFKQWAGRDVGGIEPANGHREKGRKIHLPILDGKQHAAFPKGAVTTDALVGEVHNVHAANQRLLKQAKEREVEIARISSLFGEQKGTIERIADDLKNAYAYQARTQTALEGFVSACADQTIQIMELRGALREVKPDHPLFGTSAQIPDAKPPG